MAPTIASTVVHRPAAEVYAYATDPTRFRANVEALKRRVEAQQPQHPA
jgi:hypothetical protein